MCLCFKVTRISQARHLLKVSFCHSVAQNKRCWSQIKLQHMPCCLCVSMRPSVWVSQCITPPPPPQHNIRLRLCLPWGILSDRCLLPNAKWISPVWLSAPELRGSSRGGGWAAQLHLAFLNRGAMSTKARSTGGDKRCLWRSGTDRQPVLTLSKRGDEQVSQAKHSANTCRSEVCMLN